MKKAINHEINPNYGKGYVYSINCALCTTAFALAARGYDVEAMPKDKTWRGFNSVFDVDYSNPDNYIVGNGVGHFLGSPTSWDIHLKYGVPKSDIPFAKKGASANAALIESKMKQWGNGAVAAMSVKWKAGNSAHSVALVNDKGTIKIVDAQTGKSTTDIKGYLSQTRANWTTVTRLDNAPVKQNIPSSTLSKVVKVKGSK